MVANVEEMVTTRETGTVLRAPTSVVASHVVLAVLYGGLGAYWLTTADSWRTWMGVALLVGALWGVGQALWFARLRVRMTDDGVVVGALRRESYAWGDVRAIDGRRRFWATNRVVTITPESGEPVTVLAEGGWVDDTFDHNHRQFEARWRRRTGREPRDA